MGIILACLVKKVFTINVLGLAFELGAALSV